MGSAGVESPGLLVLDLGAQKALALGAVVLDGRPCVRAWAERPFGLLREGVIEDLVAARAPLADLLQSVRAQAGIDSRRVLVGVGGGQVRCMRARGTNRSKLPVVLQPVHLEKALDAAADIGLPSDHEILHVLPTGYRVDGTRAVRSPVGMRAKTLVAEAAVITVPSLVLDNLQRVLEERGFEFVGAAAEPLAAARVALSDEDRRRGAVLLDLGADVIGAASYRDDTVQGIVWVHAGGAHVTRDITYALQVDVEQAEMLKRRCGMSTSSSASERQLEVRRGREVLRVRQQMLADIIEARMEELFVLTRDALRAQRLIALGDRIVLAGGGARLRGCVDLAEQIFEAPVRIAEPQETGGWSEATGDPACCTALGLMAYAWRAGLLSDATVLPWTRAMQRLRRVLHEEAARRTSRPRAKQTTANARLPRG